MNYRKAKKVLKRVNERLERENFGPLMDREAKGPDYSLQQVAAAVVRCKHRERDYKKACKKKPTV